MSGPQQAQKRRSWFLVGFLFVALIIGGGLSYFASPHPDGLDSVTLEGCQVVEVNGAERLDGSCIAQHARDSATAGSPLAGYKLGGRPATVGLAGVAGVLVAALLAGGLFWLLRRPGHDVPSDT